MFNGLFYGEPSESPKANRGPMRICRSPPCAWAVVVVAIFCVEYGLMRMLPVLTGRTASEFKGAIVDSVLLVLLISPLIWFALVRPLRHALKQRIRLTDQLFSELERERRRIAHDLHDGIGQSLSLIVSGLRSLADFSDSDESSRRSVELQQLAHRTLVDVKDLAFTLRPGILDDLGLVPAIERIARQVHEHHGIEVRCEFVELEKQRLPEQIETAAFRIFQEALNNAARHARCSRVCVSARFNGLMLRLRIEDDGCGFAVPKTPPAGESGLGIVGIRERAALLGGTAEIESVAGSGTKISAELPVFCVKAGSVDKRPMKPRASAVDDDSDNRTSATRNDDAPIAGENP